MARQTFDHEVSYNSVANSNGYINMQTNECNFDSNNVCYDQPTMHNSTFPDCNWTIFKKYMLVKDLLG